MRDLALDKTPSLGDVDVYSHHKEQLLRGILLPLVANPPRLPRLSERAWRAAFSTPQGVPGLQAALTDERLQRLLAWVLSTTSPRHQLGAAAAVLAVLDAAVGAGVSDPDALARDIRAAAWAARPVATRLQSQARTSPSPYLERQPDPAGRADLSAQRADSPFLSPASLLLRQAGYELTADAALGDRLAAGLDVVLAHWTTAAQPGGGLPAFFAENPLRSTKRLAVRLGRDRDLLYLLYGPQPGRGRPLQVARRRGMAYWVALVWLTERAGEPPPHVPRDALAHWRHELSRLRPETTRGLWTGADSSDTQSA